VIAPKNISPGV